MKKWILLSLALIPLAGCAYYPDDYYGRGVYGYSQGPRYRHDYHHYGYRDYDRDDYRNYYDRD